MFKKVSSNFEFPAKHRLVTLLEPIHVLRETFLENHDFYYFFLFSFLVAFLAPLSNQINNADTPEEAKNRMMIQCLTRTQVNDFDTIKPQKKCKFSDFSLEGRNAPSFE